MTVYHGLDGILKIGAHSVAEIKEWEFTEEIDTADASSQGKDWEDHTTGIKRWSGSATAWFSPSDTTGQGAMRAGSVVSLDLFPIGSTAGGVHFTGSATVTSRGVSVPMDDNVEVSFDFQGKGALAQAVIGA